MDLLTHEWSQPSPDRPFHYVLFEYHGQDAESPIFHYTSPTGAQAMLGSRQVWANATSILNDTVEISHGIDVIKNRWLEVKSHEHFDALHENNNREEPALTKREIVDSWIADENRMRQVLGTVFVSSASLDDEAVHQYLNYGNHRLQLNRRSILSCIPVNAEDITTPPMPLHWANVLYESAHKEALADAVLVSCAHYLPGMRTNESLDFWTQVISAASLMKPKEWQAEREVRCVAVDVSGDFTFSRSDGSSYVRLQAVDRGDQDPGELILGITVGPSRTRSLSRAAGAQATQAIVDSEGYVFKVQVSTSTYRDAC